MKPEIDLWALENELYDSGISTLCGVDEAGRGPLAGPVCAAAGEKFIPPGSKRGCVLAFGPI